VTKKQKAEAKIRKEPTQKSTKKKGKPARRQRQQSNQPGLDSVLPLNALAVLDWLIGDQVTVEQFFAEYWEKKPLLVRRRNWSAYGEAFSKEQLLQVHPTPPRARIATPAIMCLDK
jgi:hypothetical protein